MPKKRTARNIPQGTFVALSIVAIGLILMAAYAVYGVVQIAMRSGSDEQSVVNGSLAIIALKLIEQVIGFGDRIFRWTRGIDEEDEQQ